VPDAWKTSASRVIDERNLYDSSPRTRPVCFIHDMVLDGPPAPGPPAFAERRARLNRERHPRRLAGRCRERWAQPADLSAPGPRLEPTLQFPPRAPWVRYLKQVGVTFLARPIWRRCSNAHARLVPRPALVQLFHAQLRHGVHRQTASARRSSEAHEADRRGARGDPVAR